MNSVDPLSKVSEDTLCLRNVFMRWQCRTRQIAMRENMGQPDDSIMPTVYTISTNKPFGRIITVLLKKSDYSKTLELRHIFNHTNEPSLRREKALQLFSETYYQKPAEFSDMLTATFSPDSSSARFFKRTAKCKLKFSAYRQQFELHCHVLTLRKSDPSYQATWCHNILFNPSLNPNTVILGFSPDWKSSSHLSSVV